MCISFLVMFLDFTASANKQNKTEEDSREKRRQQQGHRDEEEEEAPLWSHTHAWPTA